MIRLLPAALALVAGSVLAGQTAGGVNWIDPLKSYPKPRFVPLTVPDEATVTNKYYVDFTSGSGTACTQAAPCKDVTAVSGKPGTTGGPAYIYIKGTGRLNLTGTLYGAAGQEIVIKPWPGDSNLVTMATTGGGNVQDANIIKSANVRHLVIDGGPNLQFNFVGSASPSSNQNAYTLVVSSNFVTVARSRIRQAQGWGPALGVGTGSGTYDHIWIVNNEIHDVTNNAGAAYGVYSGGGTGCAANDTSHHFVYFISNIFRNIAGNGIQIEPRNTASFTYIQGNAFHDSGGPANRSAIVLADACGASTMRDFFVSNNLIFNMGAGGIVFGNYVNNNIQNNTIYNYALSSPFTLNSHGISCFVDGCRANVQNNIILGTSAPGINPINRASGLTTSNNLCESGRPCGSNSKVGTAATVFASTDPNSVKFQTLTTGIPGISLFSSGVTIDYQGIPRPSTGPFDVGATQFAPLVPRNLRVQ
jgi:hypothetical protein